jgi:hypothetical protein
MIFGNNMIFCKLSFNLHLACPPVSKGKTAPRLANTLALLVHALKAHPNFFPA